MLAVDIGNTHIHFAWFSSTGITKTKTLPTIKATRARIKKFFSGIRNETVIICSVVPEVTKKFYGQTKKTYIVGKHLSVPVKSLYNPKHIGMDRLVGAYAARCLFSRPRVIIDFGTAITMDFLSAAGTYQGGIILPGIGSTRKVFTGCALLPKKITVKKSINIVPRNTPESISRGIEAGFSTMLNGLVRNYKKTLSISSRDSVVITGGEAKLIIPYLDFCHFYEPFLVFKGLFSLARQSCL